jgi:hypothetical protein
VVFYRALGHGGVEGHAVYGHAFTLSLWLLAGLTSATAALVQFLPAQPRLPAAN